MTIVVALQAHGAINSGHRIEHSLDFPGVAYADAAAVEHDHHHDHDHDNQTTDSEPPEYAATADTGGDERPIHHHHHSGGDIQLALLTPAAPIPVNPLLSANPGPAHDALPSGRSDDGPSHPPKQKRLIA